MRVDWTRISWISLILWMGFTSLPAQPAGSAAADPRAMEILKKMSDLLGGTSSFGFTAEETYDEHDGNQMLQFANIRSVAVQRPNKIAADTSGDTVNRRAWFDGQTFTLLDKEHNVYGSTEFAGTIDQLLDLLDDQFEVVIPLGELISENLQGQLTERLRSGSYLGLHQVGATKCHHLAFTLDLLDFQIWLEAGEKPLPRKLVITYKQEPGMPQYTAVFTRWNLEMETPDKLFKFQIPPGARKIDWTVPEIPPIPDQR